MNLIKNKVFYVMGVSGCGKSTIGKLLAKELAVPFFDGDDFHPQKNIEKMSEGKPLNDKDRLGWLTALNELAIEQLNKKGCVIACSALKESYRDILKLSIEPNVNFIYLKGTFHEIYNRILARANHFMPTELLQSQFDIIEEPTSCIEVSILKAPNEIIKEIKLSL
jgi:6-phosphogluconate dehydrogenase